MELQRVHATRAFGYTVAFHLKLRPSKSPISACGWTVISNFQGRRVELSRGAFGWLFCSAKLNCAKCGGRQGAFVVLLCWGIASPRGRGKFSTLGIYD